MIPNRVSHHRFAVGGNFQREIERLCVAFVAFDRACRDVPSAPAIHVFAHENGSRRLFTIAHADFEGLSNCFRGVINLKIGARAITNHIEGFAQF